MDHISTLLPKVLRKRGLKDEVDASQITFVAQRWLTESLPDFSEAITVTKYAEKTVFIEVKHSIAAQECYACTDDLLHYLKNKHPGLPIERIRILRKRNRKS